MIRRLIGIAGAILATVVLIPTAVITHTYIMRPRQVDSLDDWFQVLLPMIPPVATLLSVLILWRSGNRQPIGKGVAWGFFGASAAYMLFQARILSAQYTLISQDGTTHWGLLQLPVIWLALPLLVIAIGIGAFAGWIVKRKLSNQ